MRNNRYKSILSFLFRNSKKPLKIIFPYIFIFLFVFLVFFKLQFNKTTPFFIGSGDDSYYHVGMARYIAKYGLPQKFPYLYFTYLNEKFVDYNFLFHLILIPFIKVFGDITGPKVLIMLFVSASFSFLYFLFKEKKLKYSLCYPILLFLIMPLDFYARMGLIRAMAPALLFQVLGIYFILRNKPFGLGVLAFFYTWFYSGASFLILILALSFSISQIFSQEKLNLKIPLATALGIVLGIIINPYFPKILYYLYVVISNIVLQYKAEKEIVNFEWQPFDTWEWLQISLLPVLIFFSGILLSLFKGFKKNAKDMTIVIFSIFLLFLQWRSLRFIEYWPFWGGLAGLILSAAYLENTIPKFKYSLHRLEGCFVIGAVLILAIVSTIKLKRLVFNDIGIKTAIDVQSAIEVHNYLLKNSSFEDIIFINNRGMFPLYFYLNQKNYYIYGIDLEHMRQYNPHLWEKLKEIIIEQKNTSFSAIKSDFWAKWVLISADYENEKLKDSSLSFKAKLENQPSHFQKVFDNKKYFLFKVL